MRVLNASKFKKIFTISHYFKLPISLVMLVLGQQINFLRYRIAIAPYRRIAKNMPAESKGGLLIVSGRGMYIMWAQIWTLLSLCGYANQLKPYVLTTHVQKNLNRYFRLLNIELIYYDDLLTNHSSPFPSLFTKKMNTAKTPEDFKKLVLNRIPLGEIALSTHFRYRKSGLIDTSSLEVQDDIRNWIKIVWDAACVANKIIVEFKISSMFFTEVFMEEYGGIYYTALNAKINVFRFTGTSQDNAFIVQRRSWETDRLHQGGLDEKTWKTIKTLPYLDKIRSDLAQNFEDRYSLKWHRSKRNFANSETLTANQARHKLGLQNDRKVAIIYSHILYDTIFFFGTELFENYANWLIETVKIAISNKHLEWFIKIHPSNIWREEFGGKDQPIYEEVRLIDKFIGKLPPHVHIILPNSEINPLTWMKITDFGITVRGTSGLELAAMGKPVITAGTGRYESKGFTIDPKTVEEYRNILNDLPNIEILSAESIELAQRFAYGVFVIKPFTFSSLKPKLGTWKKSLISSDDLIYLPMCPEGKDLPADLFEFAGYMADKSSVELIRPPSEVSR